MFWLLASPSSVYAQALFTDTTGNSTTASFSSNTAGLTASYSGTTVTVNVTGSNGSDNIQWYYYVGGAPYTLGTFVANFGSPRGPGSGGFSATYTITGVTSGTWFCLVASVGRGGLVGGYTENRNRVWYQAISTTPTHITVTIPANKSSVSKQYKLQDGAGTQVGSTITQLPGAGAIIQSFTTTAYAGPFQLVEMVGGLQLGSDGIWKAVSGATATTVITPGMTAVTGTPPATPAPIAPTVDTPTPNSAPVTDSNKQVWVPNATVASTPGGTSDMSIAAYREGVDKISDLLKGEEVSGVLAADPSTLSPVWDPVASFVPASYGKLPAAPTIGSITPVTAISFTIKVPKLPSGTIDNTITIDFGASPYVGAVTVFRAICLVAMTLGFFVATFFTVRGAFVSK